MATAKTATLSFRIKRGLKVALRTAAEQEHRSIANMVEVMTREYCGRVGVVISDPGHKIEIRVRTSAKKGSGEGSRTP